MNEETTEGAEDIPADDAGSEATPEEGSETTPITEDADAAGETWREAIDDDATRKLADRYTSPAALAKALREANQELSGRIRIPGDDADEASVASFRKAVGVPEEASGYDIKKPGHLTEEVYASEQVQDRLGAFADAMHASNAPKAVVDAALDWYWSTEAAAGDAVTKNDAAAAEETEAALRREWDRDYDTNMAFANQTHDDYPELSHIQLSDGSLLGSNPHYARLAADIGRLKSEGTLQMGLAGTEAGVDVQSEYDSLSEQIHDAMARGENAKAKRLDAQRAPLSKQLFGDKKIGAGAAA